MAQPEFRIGYGVFAVRTDDIAPSLAALFKLENPDGILVSEAGVGAAAELREGRIFVEQDGRRGTGLAIVNRSGQTETVDLILRDASGAQFRTGTLELEAGEQRARFVHEFFTDIPAEFVGSLNFRARSTQGKVAAVTLRQSTNAYGEPVFRTLPVSTVPAGSSTAQPQEDEPIVFPQIGTGQGLSTQLVLFSRSSSTTSGVIRLFDSQGQPLVLSGSGTVASEFPFQLAGNGVFFTELFSPEPSDVYAGYAVVVVEEGDVPPAGSAVFRFLDSENSAISEAGVGASIPTRRARIPIDYFGTRSGVALASTGHNGPNRLDFRLLDAHGALVDSTSRVLAAAGHLAIFADELFQLAPGFSGMLEVESTDPVVPVTLKLTTNGRGQSIVTTLPVADLEAVEHGTKQVIPQMGLGLSEVGDFSTRLIFLSSTTAASCGGTLRFRDPSGVAWRPGELPGDFPFGVGPGEMGTLLFQSEPEPLVIRRGESSSTVIGPEGGLISVEDLGGVQVGLRIPPFALLEAQTITVTLLEEAPRHSFTRTIYPGVLLEPAGLTLNRAARLEIRLPVAINMPERSTILWLATPTQVRTAGNQTILEDAIEGEIFHFSTFSWEGLTLSDAMGWAALVNGMTPEQRAQLPLPPIDPSLLNFLDTLDTVNTLVQLEQMREALGAGSVDSIAPALGLLEQAALRFLEEDPPEDPCGLYHSYLKQFVEVVRVLNDPQIDQFFQQRIASMDEQCVGVDLTGSWIVDGYDETERCRIVSGCPPGAGCAWDTEEDDSQVEASVVQDGSDFEVSFPDFPEIGTLEGRLQATGVDFQPYFFTVSTEGSSTLDCQIFFESNGYGIDFGAPFCSAGHTCQAVSCWESDSVTAGVSADSRSFLGIETWDFRATVRETPPDGPIQVFRYRCLGSAQVSGQKDE